MPNSDLHPRYGRRENAGLSQPRRIPSAHRRHVTPRELVTLRYLTRFPILTSEQLAVLGRHSVRTAQQSFSGLLEKELVTAGGLLPDDVDIFKLTKPELVFSLSRDGVEFAKRNDCSISLTDRNPTMFNWGGNVIADKLIRHKLGVVDCMIWMHLSLSKFDDLELVRLAPDFVKGDDKKSINNSAFDDATLIPDVVAVVLRKSKGTTRTFYVEYDRGTEDIWLSDDKDGETKTIFGNFEKYNRYFGQKWRSESSSNPALLFVCSEQSRVEQIRQSPRLEWQRWPNLIDRFRLASRDMVSDDFMRADWHTAASDECVSLLGKA